MYYISKVIYFLGMFNMKKKKHCIHLRLKITGYFKIVFKGTTIAICSACIVKYISSRKKFESILTLLKKRSVEIYVRV